MHIVIDARGRQSSTGRYIDRLIEHLQNLDQENRYTILVEPKDPWQPKAPNFKPLACKYKKFSFNPLDQITFGRFLKKLKPDLVHFWMTPLEPIFYSGKRITTTHDLTMLDFARPGKVPAWLHSIRMAGYRILFSQSLKRARRIITISRYVASDIAQRYPFAANKTTVIYEASEQPLAIPGERPKGVAEPFILYVGTAFPHKNLETLIKSFEILHKSKPDLKLVLAGKTEQYYEALAKTASLSPSVNNIIFTGFVSDAELKWLYKSASAYVFPSLSEGFGLPGLEAMAHGLPVVSSNATCLPEVYGDAALYFDPKNAQDMAEKILTVLEHQTVANELRNSGQRLLTHYSWEKTARETLTVYREILTEKY